MFPRTASSGVIVIVYFTVWHCGTNNDAHSVKHNSLSTVVLCSYFLSVLFLETFSGTDLVFNWYVNRKHKMFYPGTFDIVVTWTFNAEDRLRHLAHGDLTEYE